MKNITLAFILVFLAATLGLAMAGPAAKVPQSVSNGILILDDFEDGNFLKAPEWWVFDNVNLTITADRRLRVAGKAADWYVGGMGTYLYSGERDLSKYQTLTMDVYGTGPDSGIVKIELYDDDNNNEQIEQDPKKGYTPVYDDRFVHELKVTWSGLKKVSIPFSDFVDNNPGQGDNVWNPQQMKGSGGLLQMQLIFMATSKTGKVDLTIDNIGFGKK